MVQRCHAAKEAAMLQASPQCAPFLVGIANVSCSGNLIEAGGAVGKTRRTAAASPAPTSAAWLRTPSTAAVAVAKQQELAVVRLEDTFYKRTLLLCVPGLLYNELQH